MAGELERLMEAAKSGDEAAVRQLIAENPGLASGRLASGESAVMTALYRGQHSTVDLLIELGADLDVFASAAAGRLAALERALREPGAVNAWAYDGWTPLHLAAFFGQIDAARLLLREGADVHAVSRNNLANTSLHAAVAGKHAEVALLLLAHGADADSRDGGGYTARAIARENRLESVIAALDG